jgi:hypothetical protein
MEVVPVFAPSLSAFEDTKPYVLTELGKQFVHYVMEDVVPQLGGQKGSTPKVD